MNRKQIPTANDLGLRGETGACLRPGAAAGLCLTVIATTDEGTAGALHAARGLATDLNATITLLKMEVVPDRFPLYRPPGSLHSTIKQLHGLVHRSGAKAQDVAIQIRLCRGLESGLQRVLRRRALVVIGGKRHWWTSSEERLEQSLRRLGHHVIFIDVRRNANRAQHEHLRLALRHGAPMHVGSASIKLSTGLGGLR